jgi:hypothetical protein
MDPLPRPNGTDHGAVDFGTANFDDSRLQFATITDEKGCRCRHVSTKDPVNLDAVVDLEATLQQAAVADNRVDVAGATESRPFDPARSLRW